MRVPLGTDLDDLLKAAGHNGDKDNDVRVQVDPVDPNFKFVRVVNVKLADLEDAANNFAAKMVERKLFVDTRKKRQAMFDATRDEYHDGSITDAEYEAKRKSYETLFKNDLTQSMLDQIDFVAGGSADPAKDTVFT